MRAVGLEPTLLPEQEPKSCASASSATPAAMPARYLRRRTLVIVGTVGAARSGPFGGMPTVIDR